jgi:hypothetical protein
MLFIVLILFIAFPLLMVSIALKSKIIALVGLGFGLVYLILFLWAGFSDFISELNANRFDESQDLRLQKLWREAGPPRVEARFWIYVSSEVQLKLWVRSEKKIEIFLSLGLFQLATDAGLKAAFQSISSQSFADVKLQNRLHALSRLFDQFKGPKQAFRYWFVSFWLYPLERLLKIARI